MQQASWGFRVKEREWEREGDGPQTTPSPPTCSVPHAVLRDHCILLSSSHKLRVFDTIIITVIFIVSILQVGKLRLKAHHLPCAGSHGNYRKLSLSPGCWLKLPPLLHPGLCPDMHSCWGLHRAGHSPCVAGLSDSISLSRRA